MTGNSTLLEHGQWQMTGPWITDQVTALPPPSAWAPLGIWPSEAIPFSPTL